jgi:hypothetical protein
VSCYRLKRMEVVNHYKPYELSLVNYLRVERLTKANGHSLIVQKKSQYMML